MKMWQLTPDPHSLSLPRWAASVCTERVLIRARSEHHARLRARTYFHKHSTGMSHLDNPWRDPVLVQCERVLHSGYREEGPARILAPEAYALWPYEERMVPQP
jgi:hypothetical protein